MSICCQGSVYTGPNSWASKTKTPPTKYVELYIAARAVADFQDHYDEPAFFRLVDNLSALIHPEEKH